MRLKRNVTATAPPSLNRADWIWCRGDGTGELDQYICFRRRFILSEPPAADAFLDIAANADFVAYLNGAEVGRG